MDYVLLSQWGTPFYFSPKNTQVYRQVVLMSEY